MEITRKISTVILLLFFFTSEITVSQISAPLQASLSVSSEKMFAGDLLYAGFILENISAVEVKVPANFFTPNTPGETGMSFYVTNKNGFEISNTCSIQKPGLNSTYLTLKPNEFHGRNNILINDCFQMKTPGVYTIYLVFASKDAPPGTWEGAVESSPAKVTIKQSIARKSAAEANIMIAAWKLDYNTATSYFHKKRIAAQGLPSVPSIVNALENSGNYSFASDLIYLLGSLPCRESGDALLDFIMTGSERQFASIPEGFSAGKMLVGEAFQSLEKMTGEDLKKEKKIHKNIDTTSLWKWWWNKHRDNFPPAILEEDFK